MLDHQSGGLKIITEGTQIESLASVYGFSPTYTYHNPLIYCLNLHLALS